MGFYFECDESTPAGLRRILVEQLIRLDQDLAGTEKDPKKAIHEVRKRCKHVRAVFRLIRPHAESFYQRENATFRDMAQGLSPFRDADARMEAFDALIKHTGHKGAKLSSLRALLSDDARSEHPADEFRTRMAAIAGETQDAQERFKAMDLPEESGFDLIEPGIRRSYKRGRKAMTAAYEAAAEESAFHEWRKRVKDLGYQLQLLRELWPPVLKGLHKEIDELGSLLGQEHDLAVLKNAVLADTTPPAPEEDLQAFQEFVDKRTGEFRAQALPIGQRIYAEGSKDFTQRLRLYWHAWREEGAVTT